MCLFTLCCGVPIVRYSPIDTFKIGAGTSALIQQSSHVLTEISEASYGCIKCFELKAHLFPFFPLQIRHKTTMSTR